MIGQGEMLSDIPLFVAAVEAGGFAPAAARLNLSRSAVGKAVARLEARLGARLLHRTTRTIVLTEDGQLFFEHCRRGLGELQAGRALLDAGRVDGDEGVGLRPDDLGEVEHPVRQRLGEPPGHRQQ